MAEQPQREMQADEPDPLARLKRLLETLTRLGPNQRPVGLERPSLDVQQPRREMEGQDASPPRRWPQTQPAGLERPPLPPPSMPGQREMPGQSEFRGGALPRQMPGQPAVVAPASPARAADGASKDGGEKLIKALDELRRALDKQRDRTAEPQQPGPQSDGSFVPSLGKTAQAPPASPAQDWQRDMLRRTQADRARRPR